MFQIGDLVCYPMHGVGVVEAIEEHTILGDTAQYYRLRFTIVRMTAMVPVLNAEQVGLRSLADACGNQTIRRAGAFRNARISEPGGADGLRRRRLSWLRLPHDKDR